MTVQTAVITGTFPPGASAYRVLFSPSVPVSLEGDMLGAPVQATVIAGALLAADGASPLTLAQTGQGEPIGPTGFWYWTVTGLPGMPDFGFYLTADSDISQLVGSGTGSGGVSAFNGRTGAVVPEDADYAAFYDAAGAAAGAAAASLPLAGGAMNGRLAPKVVALADAATIAVDASAGNDLRVTLGGNRAIGAPANPANGQDIAFLLSQDATGGRTVTWNAAYNFGVDGPPTLTATANKRDLVGFKYDADVSQWVCTGWKLGF